MVILVFMLRSPLLLFTLISTISALVLVSSQAAAYTIDITTGQDTRIVNGGFSNTSFGNETSLFIDSDSGGNRSEVLIAFDLTAADLAAFAANPGSTATLALTVTNVGSPSLSLVTMAAPWGEGTTWNTLPSIVGSCSGVQNGCNGLVLSADPLQTTPAGRVFMDVTASVISWAEGGPNYGWGIDPINSNLIALTSFEGASVADRPVLTLNIVPEPSTAIFLGLGLAALGALPFGRRGGER